MKFGFTNDSEQRRKLVVEGLLEAINPFDEDVEDSYLLSEDSLFAKALKPLLPRSDVIATA